MKGGDYVKCREGMNIIFEAIWLLLFEEFLKSETFLEHQGHISEEETHSSLLEVRQLMYYRARGKEFAEAWDRSKMSSNKLRESFEKFI